MSTLKPPIEVDVLAAVRYTFSARLKGRLMALAETEVDAVVRDLNNGVDWKAVMENRVERWDVDFVVTILDKREKPT